VSEGLGLVGREKVHYEAIERLRDLSLLPPKMTADNVVKLVADTVDDWNKMMGGKSTLPQKMCDVYSTRICNTGRFNGRYPTTAGVDGTRTHIMQLAMDTLAVAAVAVEGLIPDDFFKKMELQINKL